MRHGLPNQQTRQPSRKIVSFDRARVGNKIHNWVRGEQPRAELRDGTQRVALRGDPPRWKHLDRESFSSLDRSDGSRKRSGETEEKIFLEAS
jgi:hypothetical protein